ncbi:hypothetical protein [Streptomyces sp. NPDC001410]|uniref:hypothetical protein n=1 Tax=Streptomyces sp. NPDC001410 TaxID=3364574 RepID=UPI0036B4BE26
MDSETTVVMIGLAGAPAPAALTPDDEQARAATTELTDARRQDARQILRDGMRGRARRRAPPRRSGHRPDPPRRQ